jgi:hypothetical protein
MEVSLEHTSHGLFPLWTATRASSLGTYLTQRFMSSKLCQ